MYRLIGCIDDWRSEGHIENNANAHRVSNGLGMILIEITDVDDIRNDDHVRVAFYRSTDPFSLDSNGRPLPYSSYGIDMENGAGHAGKNTTGTPPAVNLPFERRSTPSTATPPGESCR